MGTRASRSALTVAATSTTVLLPRRGRRIAFSISNDSALVVYLNMSDDQGAALNQGIRLAPGSTVSDSDSGENYRCWQGAITAIEATGAATLSIWERVQE